MADAKGNLNGQDSQIPQATAGDKILLHAWIYNDSFADSTSNQNVIVQFYAEPWDPNQNLATGSSFLIEQKTLAGLPASNHPTPLDYVQ